MSTVKILHTADLHIGASESFLGEKAATRKAETLLTFERIIALARENSVKFLLIAGDLFDRNDTDSLLVTRVFDSIKEAGDINFIFAAGNHDPLTVTSPFVTRKIPDNLFVLGTEDSVIEFSKEKVRIYGRSFKDVYCKTKGRFSLKTEDEYINIMCIHGELTTDTASVYNAITPDFVKNCGMDYIALGHIHKRTDIGKMDSTFFAYCGCPEGQGFDESGEKGVLIGDVGKGVCDLNFVKTAFRTHIRESIDISELTSSAQVATAVLDGLSEKYGENYYENLYKITLTGAIGQDTEISVDEVATRLRERLYFVKVKDTATYALNYELLKNEPTLKGVFVKNMLSRMETADDNERNILEYALKLGLKSFASEVAYDEN